MEKKELLVIGHPLVVNLNRKFWSVMAQKCDIYIDLVVPAKWKANLIKKLKYSYDAKCDANIRKIFPLHTFFKGRGSLFFFSPWALFSIFRHHYDYIIINQEGWSIALVMVNFLLWLTNSTSIPIFITANQNIKKYKWSWMHAYERWNCRYIDGILYCSGGVRDVLEWKRLPAAYIHFPFAFDDELYLPYIDQVMSLHVPLSLGYFGRISEEKGIKTLIAACEKLAKKYKFQLIIGGAGELENEIVQYPFVKFIGTIPHDQAHLFYRQIDVFILPSETRTFWKEQFGRVLVEAAAAKKFVIGSDSGAIPEVLGHLKSDFIFREGDVEALYEKIEKVIIYSKQQQSQEYLEQVQKRSFQKFSYTSVAQDLFRQITKYPI